VLHLGSERRKAAEVDLDRNVHCGNCERLHLHADADGGFSLCCRSTVLLLDWWGQSLAVTDTLSLSFYPTPQVDSFWQAQAVLMLTPRMPLYIPCVYNVFMYWSNVAATNTFFQQPSDKSDGGDDDDDDDDAADAGAEDYFEGDSGEFAGLSDVSKRLAKEFDAAESELREAIDAVQAEHEASGTHGVRAGGLTAVGGARIARSSGNGGGAAAAAVVVSGGSDGAVLRVEALSLWTPGGEVQLCNNASLVVAAGQSVLIRGRSGCGKTSLLRAIGGLWRRGTGSIVLPATERVAFLPQQPYMALGGSLREQLIFPRHDGGEDAEGRTVGALTSSAMWRALQEVGLAQVATRLLGGNSDRGVTEDPALLQARCLDVVTRWSDTLSRGEQQRLAVARLIVGAISKSEVADGRAAGGSGNASDAGLALVLLDEATAACDAETERALSLAMRRWLPRVAIVSIGHNETLVAFHSHHLVFEEGKDKVPTWSLIEAEGAEFT
jgi:ABC-type multidrug transport system fused ATPase/permease subunit